jgi:hypothetical protein
MYEGEKKKGCKRESEKDGRGREKRKEATRNKEDASTLNLSPNLHPEPLKPYTLNTEPVRSGATTRHKEHA